MRSPSARPEGPYPASIDALDDASAGVYRRNYSNGCVLVNPTSPYDGTGVTRTVDLGRSAYVVEGHGGGWLPELGEPTGTLSFQLVDQVILPPFTAAVLVYDAPSD